MEDDNRCGGTAPEGVELYLFHIYWIFTSWEVPLCRDQKLLIFYLQKKSLHFPLILHESICKYIYINMHCSDSPVLPECQEIEATMSRQRELTHLCWKSLQGLLSLLHLKASCFSAVIVFFLCHQPQNDSSNLLLGTVLLQSC